MQYSKRNTSWRAIGCTHLVHALVASHMFAFSLGERGILCFHSMLDRPAEKLSSKIMLSVVAAGFKLLIRTFDQRPPATYRVPKHSRNARFVSAMTAGFVGRPA